MDGRKPLELIGICLAIEVLRNNLQFQHPHSVMVSTVTNHIEPQGMPSLNRPSRGGDEGGRRHCGGVRGGIKGGGR